MNGRVRILVEGVTEAGAAVDAAHLGCDAVAFDFRAGSPRALPPTEARSIGERLPPFVAKVGRFDSAPPIRVLEVAREAGLTAVLLENAPSPPLGAFGPLPWLAAVAFDPAFEFESLREFGCTAFVLKPTGWAGVRPDWGRARAGAVYGRILLSGVCPEEVEYVVDRARPYGVCCGEEYEFEPGRLDVERIEDLVFALRRAEQRLLRPAVS